MEESLRIDSFFSRILEAEKLVVDIRPGKDFSVGKPSLLFESSKFGVGSPVSCWDISLDDQKFLMVRRGERPLKPVTEMILVQNRFEELKRLAPSEK